MLNYNNYRNLKDTIILRYTKDINFDDDSFYTIFLDHLLNGDLDDVYSNSILDNLSLEDKNNVLFDARNFSHLIFVNGDFRRYEESIDCPSTLDKDYILIKLLDNYDFLIRLIVFNKEIVLELERYKSKLGYSYYSIIDKIRNNFNNDEILVEAMSKLINEDKERLLFNDENRVLLYTYPMGVMFIKDNDKYRVFSPVEIASHIYNYVSNDKLSINDINNNPLLIDHISKFLNDTFNGFREALIDLCGRYCLELVIYS